MKATALEKLITLKYGRFIEITLKNGKQLNGEFRGVTQLLDAEGNHQLTADIVNIAKFVTNPDLPAAAKEQMYGIRVTNIKDIKTYASVDEQQKEVQLQRALNATNKALAKVDWSALDAELQAKSK